MTEQQVLQRYVDLIDEHGWAVCGVGAGTSEPGFAYTIGLTRFRGHPELLVSGMPQGEAMGVLNRAGEQVRAGRRFAEGEVVAGQGSRRMLVIRVDDSRELVYAQEVYRAPGAPWVPGLQLVWSDEHGRWPRPSAVQRRTQQLFGRLPSGRG